MRSLPSGTVTFLMSDIEGSTRLVADAGTAFPGLLDRHFALLDAAVLANGGTLVSSEGDAIFAVFPTVRQALAAAVDAQRALAAEAWPAGTDVHVRMGVHAGEAVFGGRDYTGMDVHRAARITNAAWGGQVLVSEAARSLAGESLPDGVSLKDVGSHELRDLPAPEHLFQLCAPGLAADFPPPRSTTTARSNLPTPLTAFVGRRHELAAVGELVRAQRLVTLTGPGGTGKTRLAIEVARSLAGTFEGGAWFVALETVRDPDLVLPVVAQALAIPDAPGRSAADALAERISTMPTLLVLDNLEQVVAVAPRLSDLLSAAPGARILASSREPLGIAAEHVYAVPTLAVPDEPGTPRATDVAAAEAVQLFVERARATRAGFALDDGNAPAVAAICRRLDGLPLAIELAAARVNLLTPAQILQRLDHRLGLLAGTRRDLPERQRTLRGAIDWSHELLRPDERAVFRRFAVFAGGADLEAALAILDAGDLDADALDVLAALVDRSLVRAGEAGGEARYAMLETIREYAAERLDEAGERDSAAERHATHFAAVAEANRNVLTAPDRIARLDRLDRDVPNLRAAIAWCLEHGRTDLGLAIASPLKDFWRTRSHITEARRALDALIAAAENDGATPAVADALMAASELASWQTDYETAAALGHRSVAMLATLGDPRGEARAMTNMGWGALMQDPGGAAVAFASAAARAREIGDPELLSGALQGQAMGLVATGRLDDSQRIAEEAVRLGDQLGDTFTNSFNLLTLGFIQLARGDGAGAARWFGEALRRSTAVGGSLGVLVGLEAFGLLAAERGDLMGAVRFSGAADRIRQEVGGGPSVALVGAVVPAELGRAGLTPDEWARADAEGRALTTDEALALGFALEREVSSERQPEAEAARSGR